MKLNRNILLFTNILDLNKTNYKTNKLVFWAIIK